MKEVTQDVGACLTGGDALCDALAGGHAGWASSPPKQPQAVALAVRKPEVTDSAS